MSSMFNGFSSLSNLPDISKWNTSNVTNMYSMFRGCSSLLYLPDISKWGINTEIYIFDKCPNIIFPKVLKSKFQL